jgi:hypothetical protein
LNLPVLGSQSSTTVPDCFINLKPRWCKPSELFFFQAVSFILASLTFLKERRGKKTAWGPTEREKWGEKEKENHKKKCNIVILLGNMLNFYMKLGKIYV